MLSLFDHLQIMWIVRGNGWRLDGRWTRRLHRWNWASYRLDQEEGTATRLFQTSGETGPNEYIDGQFDQR